MNTTKEVKNVTNVTTKKETLQANFKQFVKESTYIRGELIEVLFESVNDKGELKLVTITSKAGKTFTFAKGLFTSNGIPVELSFFNSNDKEVDLLTEFIWKGIKNKADCIANVDRFVDANNRVFNTVKSVIPFVED